MHCLKTVSMNVFLLLLPWNTLFAEDDSPVGTPPTKMQVRAAVERSLPYLEKAGVSWMETKKCVSCHRVSFLTWTWSEAGKHGFQVDQEKAKVWLEWSETKSLEDRGEGKPQDGAQNLDGLAQLLLGHGAEAPLPLSKESAATFVQLLTAGQQADGSWKPAGQLPDQKRSKEETTQVSTMWNAFALGATEKTAVVQGARERARIFLESANPGKSTEWFVARLLLWHQQGDEARMKAAAEELKSKQHADGGWGWLVDEKSDALATGQALFALSYIDLPPEDATIGRAQHFLVSTQTKNGSWEVKGTKEKKKERVEETATYWGTAWGTLGLLRTLR